MTLHKILIHNRPQGWLTIRTPYDHQSAAVPWPFLLTTSGAMYSTVPQNEYVFLSWNRDSLLRPKSVSLMWPSESRRILKYTVVIVKIGRHWNTVYPCLNAPGGVTFLLVNSIHLMIAFFCYHVLTFCKIAERSNLLSAFFSNHGSYISDISSSNSRTFPGHSKT